MGFKLDYDDDLAAELGTTPERVSAARSRAYAKIRAKMRELGHEMPETDEGLYLMLQRELPGRDIVPGPLAFEEAG